MCVCVTHTYIPETNEQPPPSYHTRTYGTPLPHMYQRYIDRYQKLKRYGQCECVRNVNVWAMWMCAQCECVRNVNVCAMWMCAQCECVREVNVCAMWMCARSSKSIGVWMLSNIRISSSLMAWHSMSWRNQPSDGAPSTRWACPWCMPCAVLNGASSR